MSILEIFIRTVSSFSVLLLMTRLLGKNQLSHLTFFNYIAGITMGSIAASITVEPHVTLKNGLVGLSGWAILTGLVGYISLKSAKARIILDGEPSIVIKKGKVLEKTLAKLRLNMDDLSMLLRNRDIFSIQEVEYAILEPDGKLSVLRKQEHEGVTRKDLQIPVQPTLYLPSEVIVDGQWVKKNLQELNIDKDWAEREIKKAGATSVHDVFYAEIQMDGSLHVDLRTDTMSIIQT